MYPSPPRRGDTTLQMKHKASTVSEGRGRLRPKFWRVPDYTDNAKVNRMKEVAPLVDQVLAHRYLFYCSKKPIISNEAYDDAKEEAMEFGGGFDILSEPASDRPVDYPAHIRSLAFYLLYKTEALKEYPNKNCLPPDFFP